MASDDIASTHSWLTTTLFCISLFESVFRPDPTSVICLFGFYATAHRSAPAVRSFSTFLALTVFVDVLWFLEYSPLQYFSLDALLEVPRRGQMALILSALSVLYKLIVLPISLRLFRSYAAEHKQASELGETSTGEYTNGLAAKDAVGGASTTFR
ncbi:hypothetical protein KFE25_010218 [Diacronema lutheri]|uniref:Uncharacterized protein n=2 Tax=Diacronema lutheri TaxID=2081491 RepID=A0A8J5XKU3_DIALT|nr:hypothetical protein KFE25_010218 [Diacronema lutheri]